MIKSKFKILSIILMLVLFMIPSTTLKVQASDGSGTSTDGDKATAGAVGGPSHNKTGWLIYVMDESNNTLKSKSVVFCYCNLAPDGISLAGLKTRFGSNNIENKGKAPSYVMEPFTNEGKSNGAAMKEYLVTDQSNGECGAVSLMKDCWGDDFVASIANDANWVLCMEGVYWYNIYLNQQPTNRVFIGTAQMIGDLQSKVPDLCPIGDGWINKLTNGWFALCAMVEPNAKLGIKYPTNTSSPKINNDLMASEGYGMIQAWPTDGEMIPTYDGEHSPYYSPGTPKGRRLANIVKSYHTITLTSAGSGNKKM